MNIFKYLAVTISLIPLCSSAGVNIKNGNFYISYTDIIVPGDGPNLQITRTCNSKFPGKGWFGYCWGNYYETKITAAADGSVIVHENGSGARTRFVPQNAIDPTESAKKIVEAMRKNGQMSDTVAKKKIEELKKDAEMRQAYARKYNITTMPPAGTILASVSRGLQKVAVLKSGYERRYNDGKVEVFDKQGRMTAVKHRDGYRIDIRYKGKTLQSIKDNKGKQLFFEWYANGLVKHIWSTKDQKTSYTYDANHDLRESRDTSGNVYKHDYDGNHNMTKITYSDGTTMTIKYDPKTQFVQAVTNRDGRTTSYKYDSNPKKPELHYWTTVTRVGPDNKKEENRYEYEIKIKPDGSRYTYRLATTIRGVTTETIYSENSLPLKITRGKDITTFEYNDNGLLTKKSSTTGENVELKYHEKFNKITRVDNNEGWTTFAYSKQGLLNKAINSQGMMVVLMHDSKDRITKMVARNEKTKEEKILDFDYNALGKPTQIKLKNVGQINVNYNNNGSIKKVESKQGPKMAYQINQAFLSLRSIVKPSGVNLSI